MSSLGRSSRWLLSLVAVAGVGAVLLGAPSSAKAQAPDREFTVAVGETLTFNARGIERVTIGMSKIANIRRTPDNEQLVLVGESRGVTTVNLYSEEGQKTLLIRVVGVNPTSLAQEVRKVLGKGSGVEVRVVKGRVLLEGEVASETHKKKIKKLTDLYPQQVLNFTTFREAFVEGAKMVALDLYFVQMAVTDSDQMGMDWGQFLGANYTVGTGDNPLYYGEGGGGGGGGGVQLDSGVAPGNTGNLLSRPIRLAGGSGITQYYSIVGNLNVTLDFLASHSLVKTIRHGTIITEAGKEATYHTGGTLLIKLESLGGASLEEVPYGLDVAVKPVVDFRNRVKLDLDVDISQLDQTNSIAEVPGLRDTNIDTTVNMEHGQSVLVTSQSQMTNTEEQQGWFGLSRIPILGWLFKNRNFLGRSQDNALFVTPKIYEPGSKRHETMVNGVFKGLLDAGAKPEDLPELSSSDGGNGGEASASDSEDTAASGSTSGDTSSSGSDSSSSTSESDGSDSE